MIRIEISQRIIDWANKTKKGFINEPKFKRYNDEKDSRSHGFVGEYIFKRAYENAFKLKTKRINDYHYDFLTGKSSKVEVKSHLFDGDPYPGQYFALTFHDLSKDFDYLAFCTVSSDMSYGYFCGYIDKVSFLKKAKLIIRGEPREISGVFKQDGFNIQQYKLTPFQI